MLASSSLTSQVIHQGHGGRAWPGTQLRRPKFWVASFHRAHTFTTSHPSSSPLIHARAHLFLFSTLIGYVEGGSASAHPITMATTALAGVAEKTV